MRTTVIDVQKPIIMAVLTEYFIRPTRVLSEYLNKYLTDQIDNK